MSRRLSRGVSWSSTADTPCSKTVSAHTGIPASQRCTEGTAPVYPGWSTSLVQCFSPWRASSWRSKPTYPRIAIPGRWLATIRTRERARDSWWMCLCMAVRRTVWQACAPGEQTAWATASPIHCLIQQIGRVRFPVPWPPWPVRRARVPDPYFPPPVMTVHPPGCLLREEATRGL
jgi:hypothetical protein